MRARRSWTTSHWREVADVAVDLLVRGFGELPDEEVGHLDGHLRRIVASAREADQRGLGPGVILHDDLIAELAALEEVPKSGVLRCVHKCESCNLAILQ